MNDENEDYGKDPSLPIDDEDRTAIEEALKLWNERKNDDKH